MAKPRAFQKQTKPKKGAQQVPETADEFQAVGVDLEEAGGKWRAGDAAKSMRFFQRAIETYDQGLRKHPDSLDLAYNKARVMLEVATHPALVKQLSVTLPVALQQTLEAHKVALALEQDNPDTLFNTAQVLTTIAELFAKDSHQSDQEALRSLEEALQLQNRCLGIQELKYEEFIRQQAEAAQQIDASDVTANPPADDADSVDLNEARPSGGPEQWVSIVEPVTKDTLLDTILAELGTLTTLCSILASSTSDSTVSLAWIDDRSSMLLKVKLPVVAAGAEPERLEEVALTRANFISSFLEASYRQLRIDMATYKRERDEAFQVPELNLEHSFAALVANANSLLAFNMALAEGESSVAASQASQRWNVVSAAISNLAAASKLAGISPDDAAETHLLRGNCSLLQLQLGKPPAAHQVAIANSAQLLKNAVVFYRNAAKLAKDDEQREMAQFRNQIAESLQLGNNITSIVQDNYHGKSQDWAREQLEDMIDEGLVDPLPEGA